jgi:hypothetical protein
MAGNADIVKTPSEIKAAECKKRVHTRIQVRIDRRLPKWAHVFADTKIADVDPALVLAAVTAVDRVFRVAGNGRACNDRWRDDWHWRTGHRGRRRLNPVTGSGWTAGSDTVAHQKQQACAALILWLVCPDRRPDPMPSSTGEYTVVSLFALRLVDVLRH